MTSVMGGVSFLSLRSVEGSRGKDDRKATPVRGRKKKTAYTVGNVESSFPFPESTDVCVDGNAIFLPSSYLLMVPSQDYCGLLGESGPIFFSLLSPDSTALSLLPFKHFVIFRHAKIAGKLLALPGCAGS